MSGFAKFGIIAASLIFYFLVTGLISGIVVPAGEKELLIAIAWICGGILFLAVAYFWISGVPSPFK